MHGSHAKRLILEDQIDDEKPMESRIARIESDVDHMTADVTDIKRGLQAANDSIAGLQVSMAGIKGGQAELESKLIKWIVGTAIALSGTMIASIGVVFTIARYVRP